MKRILIILVAVLIGAATPAGASTYGPDTGAFGSPVYTAPIHVIDAMVGTLRPEHRPLWREGRDEALAEWDLPFHVTRMADSDLAYPWTTENIDGGLAITDMVPNAILIVRMWANPGQSSGSWVDEYQGGVVVLRPWAPWWKDTRSISQVLAHEVGHCLGFGHGGTGVMAGAYRVNDEERALARSYYEALGFVF